MIVPATLRENIFLWCKHLLPALFSARRMRQVLGALRLYAQDWRSYASLPRAEALRVEDAW